MQHEKKEIPKFGAVAIGRNEGERLKRCLASLRGAAVIVYVDSGSRDGSAQWARDWGAEVIELEGNSFTAARARNAGFRHLRETAPQISYVQFVDGDCELNERWPEHALGFLESRLGVGAVCGFRRERNPHQSIYNWLCDQEWNGPVGQIDWFGGDVMARAPAIEGVKGYRDDLVAGEDPELSVRLRAAGWHLWRLRQEMTVHDAAMTTFRQWCKRAIRSGYVYAQGAHLHGKSPENHMVWESRRTWIWGVGLPAVCVVMSSVVPWGWATGLIYPLQILRQTSRNRGTLRQRAVLAMFQTMVRFPEAWGQVEFLCDRLFARRRPLIEYK